MIARVGQCDEQIHNEIRRIPSSTTLLLVIGLQLDRLDPQSPIYVQAREWQMAGHLRDPMTLTYYMNAVCWYLHPY